MQTGMAAADEGEGMAKLKRIGVGVAGAFGLALAGGALWLFAAPPDLLRLGNGYAAKIVCSNVFLAGRDPGEVLAVDVQAPGHPLLKLLTVSVEGEKQAVTSRFMGLFAPMRAVHRPGYGCAVTPQGEAVALPEGLPVPQSDPAQPWPQGQGVAPPDAGVAALLEDDALAGPGVRALVVVRDGRIIAERYGAGFGPQVPLIGWSMTKTVNAALVGRAIAEGRMPADRDHLFPGWAGDGRRDIRLSHLLSMTDGLRFTEDYGGVDDVTRMLYLENDMAGFAATAPAEAAPGSQFRYSSGTSLLLSRLWMDAAGPDAWRYPVTALFAPLGMASATLEADASGTFVGGSYLYATARDWARFAQFLLDDGVWNGQRLLPETFTAAMRTPSTVSGGRYTQAQAWHRAPKEAGEQTVLPEDIVWMLGHDGQAIAIIPSARLVVLRMGLTPGRLGYRPQPLTGAILKRIAASEPAPLTGPD